MRPQTNAELTLYNYGRRMRELTDRGASYDVAAARLATESGFDAVQHAVMATGYDVSNAWITEGYHSVDGSPHANA